MLPITPQNSLPPLSPAASPIRPLIPPPHTPLPQFRRTNTTLFHASNASVPHSTNLPPLPPPEKPSSPSASVSKTIYAGTFETRVGQKVCLLHFLSESCERASQ